MIRVFRHDGLELMLNVDMIRNIDPGPPVVLTLSNDERIQVKNALIDVLTKINAWRQGVEEENREIDPEPQNKDRFKKAPAQ